MHAVSRALSRGLALGAAFLVVAILVTQVASIVARVLGFNFPAADAYAGYFLAGASFLALGSALYQGDHIRVTLLIQRMGPRPRWMLELGCLALGTLLSGYVAWYAAKLAWGSWAYDDLSPNVDATPLWIPQISMVLGLLGLSAAFIDQLLRTLRGGRLLESDADASVALE
ncbi:MAG: TRAP transporter small permease [Burkholderiaceae bacterium]|nr:TRAP transporter small permease [Burkholderiaceae bacterium]